MERAHSRVVDEAVAHVSRGLLALSWVMPPLVFPRSIQVSRTLKGLRRRGWRPAVVTIPPDAEPSGLKDHALEAAYAGCFELFRVDPREDVQPSPFWLRRSRKRHRPDDITLDNWMRRARARLGRELWRGRYDVLVTFAQPWIDHVVGLEMKRRYPSLPWVAHFSDPWVDSPYIEFTAAADEARARSQEQEVIEAADGVVFVTEDTARLVMAKYPESWRAKVAVVSHAYDEELLHAIRPEERTAGKFRVVHTGAFYPGKREPAALLHALAELTQDPEFASRIDVELVGYSPPDLILLAKELGLDSVVTFRGQSLYMESLAAARSADLLLLVDAPAEHSVFLPSKMVDYLMMRAPILGLTPARGASADALRAMGCVVVPPDDVTAISAALRSAFERWRRGDAAAAPDPLGARSYGLERTSHDFERALEHAIANVRA
jgi:glycosyl transferase family 4